MRTIDPERPLTYADIEPWERSNLAAYSKQYGRPMPSTHRLDWHSKPALVRAYARAYGFRVFVETGSHEGEMIAQMLREPTTIEHVYSVEIGDECNPGAGYVEKCRQRFAGDSRVRLFEGDSAVALRWMLDQFEGPALFWLDAHANGPEDPNPTHFPLRGELEYLCGDGYRQGSVILIDDARFLGFGHWPTFDEIVDMVLAPLRSWEDGQSVVQQDDIVRISIE
jgi:hypothetical protein